MHKFITAQIVIQLPNPITPPQWDAPVLAAGNNVVVNEQDTVLYQPVYTQRPMSAAEFTDEAIALINLQLTKLNLKISRVESA